MGGARDNHRPLLGGIHVKSAAYTSHGEEYAAFGPQGLER